jgi:hypothetical protein
MKKLILITIVFVLGLLTGSYYKQDVKETIEYTENYNGLEWWKANREGKPWK